MFRGVIIVALSLLASTATEARPAATSADPWRWLESLDDKRVAEWVRTRDGAARARLQADPSYAGARSDAAAILGQQDVLPRDRLAGRFVFSFARAPDHPDGVLRRTTITDYSGPNPAWEDFLDLDRLNAGTGRREQWRGATCLPPAFSRCLVRLAAPQGRGIVLREYDAGTRAWVDGGFHIADAVTQVDWIDADTVIVATGNDAATLTRTGQPRTARIWSRGQALGAAPVVFSAQVGDLGIEPQVMRDADGKAQVFVVRRTAPRAAELFRIDEAGRAVRVPVPAHAEFRGMLQRQLLFLLGDAWRIGGQLYPAASLVAMSLDESMANAGALPRVQPVAIADARTVVTGVAIAADAVFATRLDNVRGRVDAYTFAGGQWFRRAVDLPDNGTIEIVAASPTASDVLVRHAGFLSPDRLFRLSSTRPPALVREIRPRFSAADAEVLQFTALSADNTAIPYFVVRRKTAAVGAPPPMLLYAYGGFQVSSTPWYWSAAGKLWLEKGGAYAIANIRGGGEFGPGWHGAATAENRERNFDDLAAVARDMAARGLAKPQRLGLYGSAQGGLVVAGMLARHPDLFAAGVAEAPLADMLRYTQLGAGRQWIAEYGDPADPRQRASLARWSPYQNLAAGVEYPPLLVLGSAAPTPVHPGHARKLAARLEEFGQQVFYVEDEGAPTQARRAEQLALMFTFLRRSLEGRPGIMVAGAEPVLP